MKRFTIAAAVLSLSSGTTSALADLYELRITGTSQAFLGFPAVPVVNTVVYDSDAVPTTTVSANVTNSSYPIVSYSLTFGGTPIGIVAPPRIEIGNTVPGLFGNPDRFMINTPLTGTYAGLPISRFITVAFDYGFDAIDNTSLPTDVSYFNLFSDGNNGNGGLGVQLDFTSSVGNASTTLTNMVVTLTRLPGEGCSADWNDDGVLNPQDFFSFLTAYFAGAADFNGNNVTNSQDMFDFLAVYFVGC